jgi:hypothetical protein
MIAAVGCDPLRQIRKRKTIIKIGAEILKLKLPDRSALRDEMGGLTLALPQAQG